MAGQAHCSCFSGFALQADGHTCEGKSSASTSLGSWGLPPELECILLLMLHLQMSNMTHNKQIGFTSADMQICSRAAMLVRAAGHVIFTQCDWDFFFLQTSTNVPLVPITVAQPSCARTLWGFFCAIPKISASVGLHRTPTETASVSLCQCCPLLAGNFIHG